MLGFVVWSEEEGRQRTKYFIKIFILDNKTCGRCVLKWGEKITQNLARFNRNSYKFINMLAVCWTIVLYSWSSRVQQSNGKNM